MMNKYLKISIFIFALLVFLSACRASETEHTGKTSAMVFTEVAQTVSFELTRIAEQTISPTEPQEPTTEATPTATSMDTGEQTQLAPTATSAGTSGDCYRASLVSDINYPDGSEVRLGESFTKTWRLMNAGSCSWTSNFKLIFVDGESMSATKSTPLTGGIEVAAGTLVNVSVTLKAPSAPGTYTAYFKIEAPDGQQFGVGPGGNNAFYVQIKAVEGQQPTATKVVENTPTPTISPSPTTETAPTEIPTSSSDSGS